MEAFAAAVQLIFTIVIGMYFFMRLKNESGSDRAAAEEGKREAEHINRLRRITLTEPLTEAARPADMSEIIGQEEGVRALKAALCGTNPQHVIIYGPPGVGKTAAARLALEEAKKSRGTPFLKTAKFIEADATIMRFDERSIADPLIGSVHDPIYQGAGAFGETGVPQPKEGAVTKAHGGVLFIDEIGELPDIQLNRLLKVLEDRRVYFESAYYSASNKKIPAYIHDIFRNGLPADFRLIGATTKSPSDIPEAVRSRCVEVFFAQLGREDIIRIIENAKYKLRLEADAGVTELIADYAKNGRDAVKMLQTISNIISLDGRTRAEPADAEWVIKAGRYTKNDARIIDISFVKTRNS